MNWTISASIALDSDHCINAVLRDLSPSGFSARVDTPLPDNSEQLDYPIKFSLALGSGQLVEGELEICYVETPELREFRRLGARIVALSPRDQRIIDQCVADIDRQQSRLS
jgi:c-di-GMP-binding flagellar brake protein YcgR